MTTLTDDELLAEQEWQPIDTAPKDGTKVILWSKRNTGQDCYVISYWHTPANPSKPGMWVGLRNPTHWRPLPAPPKDG